MSELRMRCLELAGRQMGPLRKGKLSDHQVGVLSLALMFHTFLEEGYDAARQIAENKVRPKAADVVKLVWKEV